MGLELGVCSPVRGAVTVRLAGEIDAAAAPQMREAILASAAPDVTVTADLADVRFIDSTGLLGLVGVAEDLTARGVPFEVVSVPTNVVRLMRITGLDEYFGVDDRRPWSAS